MEEEENAPARILFFLYKKTLNTDYFKEKFVTLRQITKKTNYETEITDAGTTHYGGGSCPDENRNNIN